MLRLIGRSLLALIVLITLYLAWVVFVPVSLPSSPYKVNVAQSRTMGQLARSLDRDGAIRNATVMIALSRLSGSDRKLKTGVYQFNEATSLWQYLERFRDAHPDQGGVTVIEGWTLRQFRTALRAEDLRHDTANWDDARLLAELGLSYPQAEGLFFPSTYFYAPGSSDLDILRRAHDTLTQHLDEAWQARDPDLPYQTPYQLLIMASLIEKETSREADRAMVASVFVNRLRIGMRLQTDPAVIYGMGDRYQGRIGKEGLRRDTPYNTYTRAGLTPTPIALVGRASLDAAAHPAKSKALYFVARGDGSTEFSESLDQHNAAVRKYILKKG